MSTNERMARVKLMMASGQVHEFALPVDKAVQLMQMITYEKREEGRQWIDVYDLTDARTGQFVINMTAVETVQIDTDT